MKIKRLGNLTEKCGECSTEYGQLVLMLEPCPHGEEGEVHGGGGREEGGARDEHPRAGHHHTQAQPTNIGSELAQNTTVKINLGNI